jgi:hypothetical protein
VFSRCEKCELIQPAIKENTHIETAHNNIYIYIEDRIGIDLKISIGVSYTFSHEDGYTEVMHQETIIST